MKILQITNIISHHQLPLARKISNQIGEANFRFATTMRQDNERLNLGWINNSDEPWILRVAESKSDESEFKDWWSSADVVLCGERMFSQMEARLSQQKICLYMSERWYKPPLGSMRNLSPYYRKMVSHFRHLTNYSKFHYLAIGPFSAVDYFKIANKKHNCWKWGYFTEPPPFCRIDNLDTVKSLKIVWLGRILSWKRLDTLINACSYLQKNNIKVNLTIIGDGSDKIKIEKLSRKHLTPCSFNILPPVHSDSVADLLLQYDVYVLPSSAYEGWGAVINEAMSSGLAVIASSKAGAAAALITHEFNGILFEPGNWRQLAFYLNKIKTNPNFRNSLAKNAKITINDTWSPVVASERLIEFCSAINKNQPTPSFTEGPLTSVDNWLNPQHYL